MSEFNARKQFLVELNESDQPQLVNRSSTVVAEAIAPQVRRGRREDAEGQSSMNSAESGAPSAFAMAASFNTLVFLTPRSMPDM
jgi:hypothetical protein